MIVENRQLVTNEPVEVQDCGKMTNHFRGIYRIYPNVIKKNRRMSTCNQMDLQTLGSQPIMPKIFPDHWSGYSKVAGSGAAINANKCMAGAADSNGMGSGAEAVY
jgi:hypothetical protein